MKSAFKRLYFKASGFMNKRGYYEGLQSAALASTEARLTTPTFAGHDTYALIEECISLTQDMPIDEIWAKHFSWGGGYFGAYDYWDIRILCGLIRKFSVGKVVECSPNEGWSTLFIRLSRALESHISFDIENWEAVIRAKLSDYGVEKGWTFVLGDFKQKSAQCLPAIQNADMVFLDSDHTEDFAVWYVDKFKLFERLKPGCLIHVHDIYPKGMEPDRVEFGESPYIVDYLSKNREGFDILYNFEMSRSQRFQSKYPRKFFLNHKGKQASNASVWFVKK